MSFRPRHEPDEEIRVTAQKVFFPTAFCLLAGVACGDGPAAVADQLFGEIRSIGFPRSPDGWENTLTLMFLSP